VTLCSTLIGVLTVSTWDHANVAMIYLLGVTYVASRTTPRAATAASILAVLAFDISIVPPSGSLMVHDVQYLVTFGVMLIVGLLISSLTIQLREQVAARQAAAVAVRSEQIRGDLLSSVSHDLRTPLASIEGAASGLIQQPDISDRVKVLAETILEESQRMGRQVRNLLDMSRFEDGKVKLFKDWHSVSDLVESAIERTDGLFKEPVKVEIEPELPLLFADGILVEKALINMLENAARHAGPASLVHVQANQAGNCVELMVKDDGLGFSKGRAPKGSGLGLAICRAVVESHGGTMEAGNLSGKGAQVTLRLPLSQEADRG